MLPLAFAAALVGACGGGGGGGGNTTPAPTVTLTASPPSISAGQSSTLTWISTNATSCTASGGWSGAKSVSGSEQVGPIAATTSFTLTCTGSGGSGAQSVSVTVNPPTGGDVTVSGTITFDRVPFRTPPLEGLDPSPGAVEQSPARHVIVEAQDPGTGAVIASTSTDSSGGFVLTVPANRSVRIEAKAQMLKTGTAPTWDFSVRNNTNADALYTLRGDPFDSGSANSTRNLRAAVGWNGSSYTNRSAAPFAILDTVYRAKELILAADPTVTMPQLRLFWSAQNRPTQTPFCPDTGDIGTSFYIGSGASDDCTLELVPAGIYVLGEFASGSGDTDEFDQHVIAHEFGHYFEHRFSRSDSIGGSHGGEPLDLRVAFGEGWGNAFSGIVLSDPLYRDSNQGVAQDGVRFNMESDNQQDEGWFSELSMGEILWDVHDGVVDGSDNVQLAFARTYEVMRGPQVSTDAFTSIFSYARALRAANAPESAAIGALLSGESISGADDFGAGESNNGGVTGVTPVYGTATAQIPVFCTERSANDLNKLGNRRFFRLDLPSMTTITIQATGVATANGQAATDPDIFIFRRGGLEAAGATSDPGQETLSGVALAAGAYVIEIFDFDQNVAPTRRCMSATIQGI